MNEKISIHWSLVFVRMLLVVLLVCPTTSGVQPVSAQANNTTYSGQASVVRATVLGLPPVLLSDIGTPSVSTGATQTGARFYFNNEMQVVRFNLGGAATSGSSAIGN